MPRRGSPRRPAARRSRAVLALAGAVVAAIASASAAAAERTAAAPRPDETVPGDGARDDVRYDIAARVALDDRLVAGSIEVLFTNRAPAPLRRLVFHLYPNRFRADGDEVDDITRPHVYPAGLPSAGAIEVRSVERLPIPARRPAGRRPSGAAPRRRGTVAAPAGDRGATAAAGAGRPLAHRVASAPGLPADTLLEVELGEALARGESVRLRLDFATTVPERFGPFGVTEYGLTAVGGWHPYLAARRPDGEWAPELGPAVASIRAAVEVDPEATVVLGEDVFAPGHPGRVETRLAPARNLDLVVLPAADVVVAEVGTTTVRFAAPTPRRAHRIGGEPPEERVRALVAAALEERPAEVPAPAHLTVVEVPLRWNLTTPSDGAVVVSDRSLHVHGALRGFHEAQIAQAVYARLLRDRVLECAAPEDRWVLAAVAWQLADRLVQKTVPQHRDVHWWISWLDTFAIVDRFEKAPKLPFVTAFFENARSEDELRESVFTYASHRAPARTATTRLDRELGEDTVATAVDRWLAGPAGSCPSFTAALAAASGRREEEVAEAVRAALVETPPVAPHTVVDPALRPPIERSRYQLVLDSAEVDVSSSEFGLAALFVARERYDYTKDVAINPYFSERSYGVRVGPRLHFGPRNDATTYRHNLFGFFDVASLRRSFRDDRFPDERDDGEVLGFGLRYDYSNVYWFDDPSEQRQARLFVDWYDLTFGSDFGFVRFGGLASATTPLIGYRTIGALQVLAGFEQPLSGRGVPVQEQFSLGGHLAIRGIAVEERLARNIGLVRAEIRQHVYPEWDLDLFDTLTFRRPHVRGFVDTGQVDDSAGRALNPEHWAAGAGIGLGAVYEFLGFFPGLAYVEIATRLDRDQDEVQFLFGTRQAF